LNPDVAAIRSSQSDLVGGDEEMSEGLDCRVKVLAEAGRHTLKDKIQGGVVAGETESAVATIVFGNLEEVPEVALQPV
jgi:hypothetical protein